MTEILEAPRELLDLAVAVRPDWDRDETWQGIHACHDAGWPWKRTVAETVRLLFAEDGLPSALRHAAGDVRAFRRGEELTAEERAEIRAQAIAACEAGTERIWGPHGHEEAS